MAKVYVKNIPYEADKNTLIEALLSNGYGPINDCDLKMHKTRKNCNVGSGYVVFENEKDAKNCIAKATFVRPICMGRPLYIYPATPRKKAETISDNAGDIKEDFFLSSLELGNWLSVTDKNKKKKSNNNQPFTFSSEWKYPEDYEKPQIYFSKTEEAFILEGFKGSDQDSVLRRVKIPFRILVGNSRGIILDQRHDEISLYVTLKIPPYLYRKGEVNQLLWLLPISILKKQPRIIEWIRTVDWTEAVFGRCMVYRLIFKDNLDELRNTLDKFRFRGVPRIPQTMIRCVEKPVYLKKYEEQFQFLCELLPFNICYKLESLISYGILRPYEIEEFKLGERLSELIHNENQVDVALHALNQIYTKYWDPFDERHKDRPITIIESVIKNFKIWHPQISLINNSRCAWINHATITPTNIYYDGPHYESSNRILRLYKDKIDCFLRVTFREENFERLFVNKDEDVDIIEQRIMAIINKGFKLAGRHYEFLAFSSSQLKETSCWFVASNGDFNANFIRANMGEFEKIENPALYAARMGQCFTSTMGVLELNREQIKPLDEIVKNDLKFSDGCGKISPGLAELAAKEYWGTKNTKDKETPTVFQIRLGGCKGVVAVDPNLKEEGNVLYIRPSQKKFEAPSLNLEIVRTVKSPLPGHLNRQIILLLSTLGVKDEVFITLQEEMLTDINLMMTNEDKACQIVKRSTGTRECSHITRSIISMINAGLMRKNDLFLKAFLECKRIFTLKLLRNKARILVPDSFLLIGVVDETGILEENEIYVQTSTIISEYQTFDTAHEKIQREQKIWEGPAVITRNPCLHPGDLRKVVAVKVPELSHLKNCVVFSQKGHKPLPNLLSGGDLDGDEFFVSFDKRILITENMDPMNYDPPDKKNWGRPVEITDICEFFKDFMLNNRLGQISNLHVAFADSQEEGVDFIGCKILAALHSKAVDFSKTGIPVTETLPNIEEYPDFMEKDHKKSYKSKKILGKLYRNIQLDKSENVPLLNYDVENIILNEDFLFDGYEQYLEEAIIYREYYNNEIRHLMKKYKVKTEAEIIAAQLLGRQVEGKKSQDIRESISGTVSFIIYYCRKQFLMGLGKQDTNDDGDIDDVTPFSLHVTIPINDETKAKASAWYYVTYNQEEYPDQGENILLSFPWVVADILLAINH